MKSLILIVILSTYAPLAEAVKVITTDAHHHSVQHWLRFELKTRKLRGLPILHFDSHTDLGFIPSHYIHEGKYLGAKDLLDDLSLKKINSFQASLTDISQVLVPAFATGLTREAHLCMPPWFSRVPKDEKLIEFSVLELNKAQFIGASVNRIYPVTAVKNTYKESPFFHSKKKNLQDKSIHFYDCFNKPLLKIKGDYILSLDLDILSTNGEKHNHAKPISSFRSKESQISKKEFQVFYKRIAMIKNLLLELKQRGSMPAIVTIAKSSGSIGGSFTPSILANLGEKEFRSFFKDYLF
ncbi:MAG: hypothetical protein ACJAT2_002885 [Bacteriovoracaceae bacterium]|jgi:hypothetical protein